MHTKKKKQQNKITRRNVLRGSLTLYATSFIGSALLPAHAKNTVATDINELTPEKINTQDDSIIYGIPGTYTFTMPYSSKKRLGNNFVKVQIKGAGGGGGGVLASDYIATGGGGSGDFTEVTFSMIPGASLTLIVGEGGEGGNPSYFPGYASGGVGAGNSNGANSSGSAAGVNGQPYATIAFGGSGGGASSISGAAVPGSIIVANGGGGGGSYGYSRPDPNAAGYAGYAGGGHGGGNNLLYSGGISTLSSVELTGGEGNGPGQHGDVYSTIGGNGGNASSGAGFGGDATYGNDGVRGGGGGGGGLSGSINKGGNGGHGYIQVILL